MENVPNGRESSVEVIVLADGAELSVRPIAPGDVVALVQFHEHLASRTVYRRFFSVHPHLSVAEAERFCNTDSVDRFALVALSAEGHIVGVARMERVEPTVAEVAFVIADELQARGLGRVLAQRLAAAARERGSESVRRRHPGRQRADAQAVAGCRLSCNDIDE